MLNVQITSLEKVSENIIKEIHQLHLQSLPNDVMPNFGFSVEKKYLLELNNNRNGRIVIATDDGKIIGFLLLRFKPINMNGLLNAAACVEFISNSLRKKIILVRLIFQLLRSRLNPEGSCEVDYFVVLEQYRGKGVGAKLLLMAEEVARENGFKSIYTKTNNKSLYHFYKKIKNASLVYTFSIFSDKYYGVLWGTKNNLQ